MTAPRPETQAAALAIVPLIKMAAAEEDKMFMAGDTAREREARVKYDALLSALAAVLGTDTTLAHAWLDGLE